MAKQKKADNIVKDVEQQRIEYQFSEEELSRKSKELASAIREREQLEEDKKEVVSDFKAKIEEQNAKIKRLSSDIATGTEGRTVEADVEKDFDEGVKRIYHKGTLYDTVSLSAADHQISLPTEKEEQVEEPEGAES